MLITTIALFVFGTLISVLYGVAFASTYPEVRIDSGLVTLFAFLGLATSLAVYGAWHLITTSISKKARGGGTIESDHD
jgi:hypothetical protein